MILAICLAGGASFILSLLLTRLVIAVAPRIGFVDKPGHRKIHHNPKPLGGGIAIFWTFALILLGLILVHRFVLLPWVTHDPQEWTETHRAIMTGAAQQTPLLVGLLVATGAMHVMGLFDDRRAMGPYSKLIVQLGVTALLVCTMEWLAQETPSLRLRILTNLDSLGAGPAPSIALTVLWIAAITNAFNFLDNMDGLSSGIAIVCATAFLFTALLVGQLFVAGMLAVFIGSVLGFWCWNFPPAKIFMGDSGSLVLGFVLGVLTVRTTYLPPGDVLEQTWYATLVPIIVLAVPLYDLLVVSAIRLSRGKSPFVGDTNHFSHRLVARGMSRRTAVLCIYLVTAATSVAAMLLPQVSTLGAVLILTQTLLVLGVIALLEQHPLPPAEAR